MSCCRQPRERLGHVALQIALKGVGQNRAHHGHPNRRANGAEEVEQRILSEDSVLALIDAIPPGRNHCIVRLLYHAGLRVSELCALQWDDCHEYDDFVVLSILGKGGKRRNVRISCSMYDEMVSQIDSGVYVFTSRKNGGPIQRRQVARIVHEAGLTIDVDGVSPHWFRHCNASHALDNGATVPEVQQSLGHSSIVITQRYLHMKPNSGSRGSNIKV